MLEHHTSVELIPNLGLWPKNVSEKREDFDPFNKLPFKRVEILLLLLLLL